MHTKYMYDLFLFQAQQILKSHLRCIDKSFARKTPGDKNVWDICDYQTVHMSNLTRHQKTDWGAADKAHLQHFLWSMCGKIYESCYGLSIHTKNIHEDTFKYEYAVCHKQLHTLWNYKSHVAQHTSVLKENALLATQHSNTKNPLYATNVRSL